MPVNCGLHFGESVALPIPQGAASADLFELLEVRTSEHPKAQLEIEELSSVMWHAARCKKKFRDGVGIARSNRPYPSAGGLYETEIVILQGQDTLVYDSVHHAMQRVAVAQEATVGFRSSLEPFAIGQASILVLAAHWCPLEAAYSEASSLLWRDSGSALSALELVIQGLGLLSTQLGILGGEFINALPSSCGNFLGTGIVAVGPRQ